MPWGLASDDTVLPMAEVPRARLVIFFFIFMMKSGGEENMKPVSAFAELVATTTNESKNLMHSTLFLHACP